jgi:ribosomal protein L7/L12
LRAALEAGASPVVAYELTRGNKINAIKAYRMETGEGLKESKDAVDRVEAAFYRYEPWPSVWAALRGR